jgi:membrane protein
MIPAEAGPPPEPASGPGSGSEPAPEDEASRLERIKDWVHTRQDRIEAARTTSPTVDFAFRAASYDTDTGAPVLAAALAFRVFLFQVPYACLSVIVLGFYADLTGRDVHTLFRGRGIARLTTESVVSAASLSGWARVTAFFVVAYALFLSARSFVKVLNIVHALVWDVPRRKLASTTRAALIFLGLMTVLFVLSLGAVSVREHFNFGGLALLILYTSAPFALWWAVSWRMPHRPCPLIALAPGAAVFAIGFELLHLGTVIWFPHLIQSKSEVYGTIGIALAFLFWAYLIGRVITFGTVLNAALWARYGSESAHPLRFPSPPAKLPIVGDRVSRIWERLFGNEPTPSGGNTPDGNPP